MNVFNLKNSNWQNRLAKTLVFIGVIAGLHPLLMQGAPATVVFQPSSLLAVYDGTAKSVMATTIPSGLTVNITYNGASAPPTDAGPYTVVGTISDAFYTGSATNQLRIAMAGPAVAWGRGGTGQLGNGGSTNSKVPVTILKSGVLAGKTISAVAGGNNHSYALTSEGLVYAWGANNYGQLGNQGSSNSLVPVLVYTNGVLSGKRITAIVSGENHALALSADGKLFTWGWNWQLQLGNGTSVPFTNVPVAVDMTGVLAGKTVVALGTGNMHNQVVTSDGKVFTWGNGGDGQLGNGAATNSAVPVAVNMSGALSGKTVIAASGGWQHSVALTSDGLVYTWGRGASSQLGNGATTNSSVPVAVSTSGVLSGKMIVAIGAGEYHCLAVSSEGRVYAWGPNSNGELGNGTNTSSSVPVPVATNGALLGKQVVTVCATYDSSTALTDDGQVFSWGANGSGELGNPAYAIKSLVPVPAYGSGVLAGQTVVAISSSSQAFHVIALTVGLSAPALTSATNATGAAGQAFTFTVMGNNVLGYSATGLPGWLALDGATGILSGTPPAAGLFNITTVATNAFGSTSGNLAITILTPTTVSVVSSLNPAGSGASVTFTATVTPSAGSGTVTFKDGATTLGTGTLSGSTATFATSALSMGDRSITAEYSGDASYYSSISSPLIQTVNASGHPPVAVNDTLGSVENQAVWLPAAKLAANDTDPDGDTLTVTAVSATSTNGGTVTLDYGYITYYPPTDVTGADSFTYTVSDGHGNTDTGTVNVTIASSTAVSLNVVYGPVVEYGDFVVRFAGTPGCEYTIEYTDSLDSPNWQWYANVTAPTDNANGFGKGIFEFRESTSVAPSRFYRTVYPSYWFFDQ
jgi:alpha-tubulin suppressor-like RCC1 family protein